jgi:type II secretory pathway component PulC
MASRYSLILSFILATLLAVGGVELFYGSLIKNLSEKEGMMSQPDKVTTNKRTATPKTAMTKTPQKRSGGKEDYSIITRRGLFGKSKLVSSKPVVKEEPVLTTTSLNLTLLGTVSGKDNDQRAIIRNKSNKKQDIYYKGDSVSNALIKEILRGKIILTVNGKDEVLLMEESKSPPSTGSSKNYAMPDVVKKPTRRQIREPETIEEDLEENIDENLEEDIPPEDLPPATTPKRRMTLKPKRQQVTEP